MHPRRAKQATSLCLALMSAAATEAAETGLLAYRVARLEEAHKEAVGEIRDAVQSIDNSLKVLAVVQEQHGATRESLLHATKLLHALTERLNLVERELPTLKLVRGWIIAGVLGVVTAVGYAAINLVLR